MLKMENLWVGQSLGPMCDHGKSSGQAEGGHNQVLLVLLPQLLVQVPAEVVRSLSHHQWGSMWTWHFWTGWRHCILCATSPLCKTVLIIWIGWKPKKCLWTYLDVTFDFRLPSILCKHFRNLFRFCLNRLHAFLSLSPFLNSRFFCPSTKAWVAFCILTEVSFMSLATSLRFLATLATSFRSVTASFSPMLCRLSSNNWVLYNHNQKKN